MGGLTLWVTQRENRDQLYAVTARTEELEPFGSRRGQYSVLEERTSVQTSIALSFRDADHVWVPQRPPTRKQALAHFDETAAIAARVVIDREYPAAFGTSATELDGRNYAVIPGYAVVTSVLQRKQLKGRSGVVLIQGAVSSGHVVNCLTIAIAVSANGNIGRAKAFVGSQEEDILAHVGDQRAGDGPTGRDVLARIATHELLEITSALLPYPYERELLGRPLRLWTRDLAIGAFMAGLCISAAAFMFYLQGVRSAELASQRDVSAREFVAEARRLTDRASWAISQRQSIDTTAILDAAVNVWRPLTRVRVEADNTNTALSVVAAKVVDVVGQPRENPLLTDPSQLPSLFSPPSSTTSSTHSTQTTSDFNEIITTYRAPTPVRLSRLSDR